MNHLIVDYIKGKLNKRRQDSGSEDEDDEGEDHHSFEKEKDFVGDSDPGHAQAQSPIPSPWASFEPSYNNAKNVRNNSTSTTVLNDIAEERGPVSESEDTTYTKKEEEPLEEVTDRRPPLTNMQRLKKRVSSLPDLRLKALAQHRNRNSSSQSAEHNTSTNTSTTINPTTATTNPSNKKVESKERIHSPPSFLSLRFGTNNDNANKSNNNSSNSTISANTSSASHSRKSAKLATWLNFSPAQKKHDIDDTETDPKDTSGSILKQKVVISNAAGSSLDERSLSSEPGLGSVGGAASISRSSVKDLTAMSPVNRSKSFESVSNNSNTTSTPPNISINRLSSARRSISSFADSVMRTSIVGGQHTREASLESANDATLSKLNVRRMRSKTVDTVDQNKPELIWYRPSPLENVSFPGAGENVTTRSRSDSASSNLGLGITTTNGTSTQRNASTHLSRRSNSIVTTLTNIMSLRSVTGMHSQKFPLPTPIPFSNMEKPPKPNSEESEEEYLDRILPIYQKYLAIVLCAREDPFILSCLRLFMERDFDFSQQPLDLALRTVLLFLELPKEGQQIDRFLRCFSSAYYNHNYQSAETSDNQEHIWKDSEQVYFLTYSLLVLHTDNFNPNNKEKITKAEFVKLIHSDTDSSGKSIPREYIEYLYENITAREFPVTILPPYEVDDSLNPQERIINWFPPSYSPVNMIKSQWLSHRSFLILGNKSNPSTYQYSLAPPPIPSGPNSSTSSSLSLFAVEDIDPYHYIINDSLKNISLENFVDPVPYETLESTSTLMDSHGVKKLLSLLKDTKGGYLKFNKTQLLSKLHDVNIEILNEDASSEIAYLKILKMGELEMKVSTRKFSLVGNVVKSQWRSKFAILTTSHLLFFDGTTWLDPKIELDSKTNTSNYIIDLSLPLSAYHEINYCNNLFLTESKSEAPNILSIINQNLRRDIMFRDKAEAEEWRNSIYFSGSLDGCKMDIKGLSNTFIVERKVSLQEKIVKLQSNHEQNMSKWHSLYDQLNLYLNTAPISVKTRSSLIDHVNGIRKRMEMVSYQNERLELYIKLLELIVGLEPSVSGYVSLDLDSIDESFLFNQQQYRKSSDLPLASETDQSGSDRAGTT